VEDIRIRSNYVYIVRFQVVTAASMKLPAIWDITPCSLTEIVLNSETSVYFNETSRRCIPEDWHLHVQLCTNN
jgi:hypothetical protein